MGVGLGRNRATIGTDGSRVEGTGTSVAVYGSYQPSQGYFVDGLLGIGRIEFDTRRWVAPAKDYALAKRQGHQWFASVSAGREFGSNGTVFSPYVRLDYTSDQLQDAVESGAGTYALAYSGQTASSLQGTLGARAESIHLTSFGWAIPRMRAELRHEFQSDRLGFISYADQIGGPRYALNLPGVNRDALVLGLGTEFVMRDGWSLGIDYQLSQSFGTESSYALRVRLAKELDVRGLPKLVANYVDDPKRPKDIQVDASTITDSNITRAKEGSGDVRTDVSYLVNVSKLDWTTISENLRLGLTATAGGERFQSFNGLSRLNAGLEAELQYRASSDFDEPTWSLFGKWNLDRYATSLRSGYRLQLGGSVRQALTDRITAFGALSRNIRVASSDVFTLQETSVRGNLDYAWSDRATLYATGEWRHGDAVSTGRPSLENISIAKVFVQDDAFPGGGLFSYKFEARTSIFTLGWNYGFGPRDSLDFSWRHVRSTPVNRPAFVVSPESYITNQLGLTYLVRF
jgi:opacity protein-like surface antigen